MKLFIASLSVVVIALVANIVTIHVASAAALDAACSSDIASKSAVCQQKTENLADKKFITDLTNTLLFLLGTIAVVAIIIGGIRYATANGEAQQITSAKNIIMYAVIGLIVAIMAWAIVSFVVSRVTA